MHQSTEANSRLNCHRKLASLNGNEMRISEMMEPKSEFSDSDDDETDTDEPDVRGKSFKRRFSETFGTCFAGRKE